MKYYYIILIFLTACGTTRTQGVKDTVEIVEEKHPVNEIGGHWTLTSIEFIKEKQSVERYEKSAEPNKPQEWSAPVYMDEKGVIKPHAPSSYLSKTMKDLIFSKDSVFWMNYPVQMEAGDTYTYNNGELKIKNDTCQKSVVINTNNDTLFISYLDHYGLYLKETYKKVSFDDSLLAILKLYKVNYPELAGTWELIREDSDEFGQEYVLDFPYKIPDKLVLTKEELTTVLYTEKSIQMLTDGKKQRYFLNYINSELVLTPDNWYNPNDWLEKGRYVDRVIRFRKVD